MKVCGTVTDPLDSFINFQKNFPYRWKLYKRSGSPYIYVRDSFASDERITLKPLRKDDATDCQTAWNMVQETKDKDWPDKLETVKQDSYWVSHEADFTNFLNSRNKGSTNNEYFSLWRNLKRNEIKTTSKAIHKWLCEKTCGSKPFQKRLDFLKQVQIYIRKDEGKYPAWFTEDEYITQRGMHNEYRKRNVAKKKKKERHPPRAIVSKKQMEDYLHANIDEFPWQCWCLAMMMNYGLRNHELWYIKPLENLFLLIPGRLTKSPEDHQTWPAFADWDKKYNLFRDLEKYQNYLRSKIKPMITSATVTKVTYQVEDKAAYDNGIGQNNKKLGEYITRNTLGASFRTSAVRATKSRTSRMPPLLAKSTDGLDQVIEATPYDLRHTWAVTMYSEPAFADIPVEQCAAAMGHGVGVHKDKYLLWADNEKLKDEFIKNWKHPFAA